MARPSPPIDVVRALRREVGFACPVAGCGSPFLTWHHFDPPWSVRQHFEAAGMIALCREHHDKADVGAFTVEQLRSLKVGAGGRVPPSGRLDWMRQKLLIATGGCYYYRVDCTLFQFRGSDLITLSRDEDGCVRASAFLPSRPGQARLKMFENVFFDIGDVSDFECPPSGRLIDARYADGDRLRIEFREVRTDQDATGRYPGIGSRLLSQIAFPFTAVELTLVTLGGHVCYSPTEGSIGGFSLAGNSFVNVEAGAIISVD